MSDWLRDHLLLAFVIIYVCLAFVYVKVFRMRRLPILKEAIVYLLLGVGALILLMFQVDLHLPIVNCLLFAVGLMFVVRIRTYFLKRAQRTNSRHTGEMESSSSTSKGG